MPFCQFREDQISLSLLHVRYHREEQPDSSGHAPCLARRHQASLVRLRLAFSESKIYLGALGRQIPWGDGLAVLSPERARRFEDTYEAKRKRSC